MSAQTQYDLNMTKGFPGQVANIADSDTVTGIVATGQTIGPGIWVQRTASAESAPTSLNKGANYVASVGGGINADNLGIAVRDIGREGAPQTGTISYTQTDQFPVLRSGYIYLTIPSGGNAGDQIKFNDTTGVMDAGSLGGGETGITGAKLESDVAAGGVGLVWIPAQITFFQAI